MPQPPENDDLEFVPIPLDRETIVALARLGRMLGEHPVKIAASLLRDVVKDDALAHAGVPESSLN